MTDNLSGLADAYVRTVNQGDAAGFLELFADDAVVEDAGREIRGLDAISKWSTTDIFALNVRLEVIDKSDEAGEIVLTAKVDGDFDRTGLPDPLNIVHTFRVANDKIGSLTCRLG